MSKKASSKSRPSADPSKLAARHTAAAVEVSDGPKSIASSGKARGSGASAAAIEHQRIVETGAESGHIYHRSFDPSGQTSLAKVARLIRPGSTVLDLGPGPGTLGRYLREELRCTVDGVELLPEQVALAKPYYRHLLCADLSDVVFADHFAAFGYDYIVCADVLEHLAEPGRVLEQLAALLRPDGKLLISIPNIAYVGFFSDLMTGDFAYRVEGLLDATHLRFFTRRSLHEFLTKHGFSAQAMDTVVVPLAESEFSSGRFGTLPPAVGDFLLGLPDSGVYQFIVEAVPSSRAQVGGAVPGDERRPSAGELTPLSVRMYYTAANQAYSEDQSTHADAQATHGRMTFRLRLPDPQPDRALTRLRFDPADRPGMLLLHGLKLVDAASQPLWAWNGTGAALAAMPMQDLLLGTPMPDGALPLFATGLDSAITLDIPTETLQRRAAGCQLVAEISRPGMDDYWNLVARFMHSQKQQQLDRQHYLGLHFQQRAELYQLRQRLSQIEHSPAWKLVRPLVALQAAKDEPEGRMGAIADGVSALATRLRERRRPKKDQRRAPSVDVVVPVYRGLDETRACIESVLRYPQATPYRLLVLNDGSPEPELAAWLTQEAGKGRFVLLENEQNLGFVATVNRGMEQSSENDVVLLNSDTEVAHNWLDRLVNAAYRADNIATVTPFSNNATICSYPRFCQDNRLPPGVDVPGLDALFSSTHPGVVLDIPTGVGFCMYIRRAALAEIGLFSVEHFGKGYGEENDFCFRARNQGWRNVLSADTFVYHSGGVSFADSQNPRKAAALQTLRTLYPDYESVVHRHILQDPARALRAAIDTRRLQQEARPVVLSISHSLGGGTYKHVLELAEHLAAQATFLLLKPKSDGCVSLRWLQAGSDLELFFHLDRDYGALLDWLRMIGLSRVHMHHTIGLPSVLWGLARDLQVPLDFTAHDFYSFCPQISLTRADHRYCGEPDEDGCNQCLRVVPAPGGGDIQSWRHGYANLLRQAERVFCPSRDTAARLAQRFPLARVVVAPHTDQFDEAAGGTRSLPDPQVRPIGDRRLRIAVLGALSPVKGADPLEEVALLAKKAGAPLEFHLLGRAYRDLAGPPSCELTVHGPYKDEELPSLLAWLSPDLVWFPATWPETYSYTLSACLVAGLPVVAPNLGAFPERLAGRGWSVVVPWDLPAAELVNLFARLAREHFERGTPPPADTAALLPRGLSPAPVMRARLPVFGQGAAESSAPAAFSYRRDYVGATQHSQRAFDGAALSSTFFAQHAYQDTFSHAAGAARLGVISAYNRVKALPLFRNIVEAIPATLRTRAYRWLASGG